MPATRHGALFAAVALGLCLVAALAAAGGSWAPVGVASGGSRRFAILAVLVAIGVAWLAIAARLAGATTIRVLRAFGGVSVLTVAALVLALVAIGFVWQLPTSSARCSHVNLHSPDYAYCLGAGQLPTYNGVKCIHTATKDTCVAINGGAGTAPKRRRGSGNGDARLIEGSLLAAAAVLLASLAAYQWWRRRRRPFEVEAVSPLLAFVDESVDDLRREADVRRAIEACYARMERTLGRVGLVRGRAEAPLEYLERTSVRFGVARGSLERLTGLFEEAKFSRHALGEPTREEAIDALLALRAEATA
jgi:Domain of unknown function (DUF4129)